MFLTHSGLSKLAVVLGVWGTESCAPQVFQPVHTWRSCSVSIGCRCERARRQGPQPCSLTCQRAEGRVPPREPSAGAQGRALRSSKPGGTGARGSVLLLPLGEAQGGEQGGRGWAGRAGQWMPLSEAGWRPQQRGAGGLSRATLCPPLGRGTGGRDPARMPRDRVRGSPPPKLQPHQPCFTWVVKSLCFHRPGTGAAAKRKTPSKSPDCFGASRPEGHPWDLTDVLDKNSVGKRWASEMHTSL